MKVTRNGKIISRRAGQNHFNAKENSRSQMKKNRAVEVVMGNRIKRRFITN